MPAAPDLAAELETAQAIAEHIRVELVAQDAAVRRLEFRVVFLIGMIYGLLLAIYITRSAKEN